MKKYKHLFLSSDGTFEYVFSEQMTAVFKKTGVTKTRRIKYRTFKPVGAVYEETKKP